jgi:peptidyl-prolyl cis-trans isomerase C
MSSRILACFLSGALALSSARASADDTAAADHADVEAARRARVVARVGERRITVGEVEDAVEKMSPMMRARYRDPVQLRSLVDQMLRFELLAREAAREGGANDREVRAATSRRAVQELMRIRFDETITPESVPVADVEAYYAAHPEEFNVGETRRASHILVATRAEADALLSQAREADARAFRTLAQGRSLDAESRARGGDLRYFDERGRGPNDADAAVDAALVRAAFALRTVGDVSDPVEVSGQWSLVKLTGLRPAVHRTLIESQGAIRERLWRERRQAAIEAYVAGLRERGRVVLHAERMEAIEMAPPTRDGSEDEEPLRAPEPHRDLFPRGSLPPAPSAPTSPAE